MQRATAASSAAQRGAVRARVGAIGGRAPGSARASASRIAATARIALRGSCHQCGSSPRRRRGGASSSGASVPDALDRLVEPLVDVAARAHDEVGVGERLDVVRAHLVVVRVGVGRQQPARPTPRRRRRCARGRRPASSSRRPRGRLPPAAGVVLPARRRRASDQQRRGWRGGRASAASITENHSHSHIRALRSAVATPTWTDHAHRELSRAGHRAGGAREEVLALLARQDCCLSAQEIHDRLRAAAARPSGWPASTARSTCSPSSSSSTGSTSTASRATSRPTPAASTTTTRSATAAARWTRSRTPSSSG